MLQRATVLVFVKYPEPGRVKTRLARTIGTDKAAALYRHWIGLVLGDCQALRPTLRLVAYFDGGGAEAFRDWHSLADDWWPQPAGDLGDRLSAGMAAALQLDAPVLAIGTDCLEIGPDLLAHAVQELSRHDVVFGPSADGGYYLVGTAQSRRGLFQSVRWSSPFTLDDHLRRCRDEGWSVGLLPRRHDIDTWADWQGYLRRVGPRGTAADAGRRHSHLE